MTKIKFSKVFQQLIEVSCEMGESFILINKFICGNIHDKRRKKKGVLAVFQQSFVLCDIYAFKNILCNRLKVSSQFSASHSLHTDSM